MATSKQGANGVDKRVMIAVVALAALLIAFMGYRSFQPEPYRVTPQGGYRGMAEEDKAGHPSTAPNVNPPR